MHDFAIARKVLRDDEDEILSDIIFKKDKEKWYLNKAEDYHRYINPN